MSACRRLRRKTQAAIPTAKAPDPRPVSTITLNVFQMPHPNASFMPLTGPRPASSRYAVKANASRVMPHSARKNPFTTENPYTGTARSQRVLLTLTMAGSLLMIAVLIVAPSIRSLFRVHGLPAHDLSGSCELPAPGRRTRLPAARSTDKGVSASAEFWRAPTPAPVPADRVFQTGRETDIDDECRRCQSPHTRAADNSGRDYS